MDSEDPEDLVIFFQNVFSFLPSLIIIQWFSARGNFAPKTQGIFIIIWFFLLSCHAGGGLLLASSRERPGMLLNILRCIGQLLPPSPTKKIIKPNVSSPEAEDPAIGLFHSKQSFS